MTEPGWGGAPVPPLPACVRHPDRPTGLSCTRCDRPACPECLRPAAVGQHCVECVAQAAGSIPRARTMAGGVSRTVSTPVVTYALMALNILVFALTAAQSGGLANQSSSLFRSWQLVPLLVADGDAVRILGSGFLHSGIVHLAVNMFALYVIGRDCELVLGRSRYLAVYVVALLGGAAAVMWLSSPLVATVGASGAVFGLLGAQAVILVRLRRSPTPVLVVIGLNVVLSIAIPGISLWGHLGGLAAGAAATAAVLFVTGSDARRSRRLGWFGIAGVGLLALALIGLRAATLAPTLVVG
ncbi:MULTISPECIES: rhomboid family intramembrane serine protease [unclassified Rhodococcus (in: high G+C Gram-positive bacteria)]|uniref:rhomboid family intramembrane serine protease n=1 Tax=unclassified Rhodococcus (in: high G+C Gram-positive bacteria) TaxID=192944 RepID=UPI0006F402E5|nr:MULTISPECIES: rhomboid family intramembrane serine protease [unclassified Rhodococcus (in: high G+C Gram-positive bacteria)]KQU35862.1 protease [Rhodococcus sp. Leaf225]KQU48409.1 protease [Rhodococcus sp. Leaf258]